MDLAETADVPDLMLTEGGPAYTLLRRLKLVQPEATTGTKRTALMLAAITWVPLCLLSIVEGRAFDRVTIPFFHDIAAHVRFLIAVPILILADVPVGRRLTEVARHFLTAGLIRPVDAPRYSRFVLSAGKMRDSHLAELVLLGLAYSATFKALAATTQGGSTWFRPGAELTLVGYWYAFVSLPIYMFFIWRWAFRMVIWSRFLWQVSKIDLALTPSHPDAAGGLGFLGKGLIPFGAISFALSSVVCAGAASRIIYNGGRLKDFQSAFIFMVIFILIVFTGPLVVFAPRLIALRQIGLLRYGTLASRYTQLFDRKWIDTAESADQRILGTADIQALGSLGESYGLIQRMKIIPLELSDFIALALPTIVPALPLILMVVPLKVILQTLFKLIA